MLILIKKISLILCGLFSIGLVDLGRADEYKFDIRKLSEEELHERYVEINEYLLKVVPIQDEQLNMKAAQQLLDKALKSVENKDTPESETVLSQINVWSLFVDLETLLGTANCNREGRNIILQNKLALGTALSLDEVDRLDSVVKFYSRRHAVDCQYIYPDAFKTKSEALNRGAFDMVRNFADVFINKALAKESPDGDKQLQLYEIIRKNKLESGLLNSNELLDWFEAHVDEMEIKVIMGLRSKVSERDRQHLNHMFIALFIKYLVKPCEYYAREVGPDVFEPVEMDAEWWHDLPGHDMDFYYGWARYQLCRYVTDRQFQLVETVLKSGQKNRSRLMEFFENFFVNF